MERRVTTAQLRRLVPEPSAGRSAYVHLATTLRALVLDGRVPLGARLPAERELASALGLSRTTITAAYRLLRRDGYLASRRGAGTFTTFPDEPASAVPWLALEADESTIDLTVAAPRPSAELIADAASAAVEQLPRHLADDGYHVLGLPALREAVAERYRARGLPTTAGQIAITAGAQGALSLLARTLLSPGAATLVESPTYPNALDAFRSASARLLTVPVETGEWDDDLVESAFRQTLPRLAYLIPEFHNPTGQLMPHSTRETVVRAARAAGTHLVVDESFAGLALEPGLVEPPPLAALDPERVISIGALSKCAWGGVRVGWIRATASLVQRVGTARPSLDIANPVLDQLVAVELLARLDEILAAQRERLALRLAALTEAFDDLPGWQLLPPQGGLSAWVALDCSSTALAAAAAEEGVRIPPGPRFGTDGALERFVRFPFALPPAQLREAASRLARAREHVPPLAAAVDSGWVL